MVIDIEATCWRDKIPPKQRSEIIEIGICVLDTITGRRLTKESMIVKPRYSEVSPFCTELTTLTPTEVEKGISLKAACNQIYQPNIRGQVMVIMIENNLNVNVEINKSVIRLAVPILTSKLY